jgi:hypothetical protein
MARYGRRYEHRCGAGLGRDSHGVKFRTDVMSLGVEFERSEDVELDI